MFLEIFLCFVKLNITINMKAVIIKKSNGVNSISVENISQEEKGKIKVRVIQAGINPVDYNLINGKLMYNVEPYPHIPGTEVYGEVETDGKEVKKGDKVIIFPRLYDETCDKCQIGEEEICRNGKLFGISTNGGYAEYTFVEEKYLYKVEGNNKDAYASLPVGGLTAYHALMKAQPQIGNSILIYGASGNTGLWATILSNMINLKVYAVSSKPWVKQYAKEVYNINEIPQSLKVDIVFNSLGGKIFEDSLNHLDNGGKIVTFGIYTGKNIEIDLSRLYPKELSIISTTGGSKKEFKNLISITKAHEIQIPVQERYKLENINEALKAFENRSTGRIVIEP